jgi:formylglycine-generating enzyme required for sulfatase activity
VADIFLSYNREDQARAKAIANALQNEGFDVWWDTILRAGQTYDEVTERQLREASAVVVLWSTKSVKSKWVRAEATLGDRKAALIPVMIEPCDRPIMFELIQTADLTQWQGNLDDPQWKALVEDVREHVQRKKAPAGLAVATPPVAEPAAPAAANDTIEAAFWMSIKDGEDAEEFDSYLERYPQGHFASLAKKRLAALIAANAPPVAATPAAAPPAPAPAAEVTPPKPAPLLPPKPTPRVDAFQQRAAAPAKNKAGSPAPLLLGLAVLVVAGGAAAFTILPGLMGTSTQTSTAAEAPPPPPPATPEVQAASVATPPADAPVAAAAPTSKTFSDCSDCPEMTRLDGGVFTMGSPATEPGHRAWEGPQREVTISPIAVSTHEVTFAQWDACVASGGCKNYTPTDKGWGRGAHPVIMVSWNEAQDYLKWLSGKTGKTYRLPTEAEWEYAARGGTSTAYWWGAKFDRSRVVSGKTAEVGAHGANGFGLFDVTGNVTEWVEDCYVNSFKDAPKDGSAVKSSGCSQRVIRGGGWKASSDELRIANRSRLSPSTRDTAIGFRVVTAP